MKQVRWSVLCLLFPTFACAGSGGRSPSGAERSAASSQAIDRDASTRRADGLEPDAGSLGTPVALGDGRHQADASIGSSGDAHASRSDAASFGHASDAAGDHQRDATAMSSHSDAMNVDAGRTSLATPKDAAISAASTKANEACPDGMVLIDGDYCENLEMSCLRSTYAPQNQKTICWDFKEPTVCTGAKSHKRFCIDRYEYPNKKDTRPRVMVNFPQAQALCADQGKRMCTETEWTTACEGPSYKPYPYGYHRDPTICRGDQPYPFPDLKKAFSKDRSIAEPELARTYAAVPSGSQPGCVSDYGVYDMPGNADELASSETAPPRSTFDNVTTGGPWLEGVRNQCRPKIYTHNEGFAYYYLSFRCCAEADGKPSDPRSPKQIKREEKWRRVPVPAQVSPPVSAEPRRALSP